MDREITCITALRSKFNSTSINLWHAAIQIEIDGGKSYEIWQFGRYNAGGKKNAVLRKRDKGTYADEQIITSCKVKDLSYSKFINFSQNYCSGKMWTALEVPYFSTNCQYYALKVLQQFTIQKCCSLMINQIGKNWLQAVGHLSAQAFQKIDAFLR